MKCLYRSKRDSIEAKAGSVSAGSFVPFSLANLNSRDGSREPSKLDVFSHLSGSVCERGEAVLHMVFAFWDSLEEGVHGSLTHPGNSSMLFE